MLISTASEAIRGYLKGERIVLLGCFTERK